MADLQGAVLSADQRRFGELSALRNQIEPMFGPVALVGVDGRVGEQKLAALATRDHHLDRIEQHLRCDLGTCDATSGLPSSPVRSR
jgi:hypothetical protein